MPRKQSVTVSLNLETIERLDEKDGSRSELVREALSEAYDL